MLDRGVQVVDRDAHVVDRRERLTRLPPAIGLHPSDQIHRVGHVVRGQRQGSRHRGHALRAQVGPGLRAPGASAGASST